MPEEHTADYDALMALIREHKADAWDEGYHRGIRDAESDLEPADNPYRTRVIPSDEGPRPDESWRDYWDRIGHTPWEPPSVTPPGEGKS